MPANPVVRASSASYGRFSDLSVDSLEDITAPTTPVIPTVPISQDFVNQMSAIDYTKACINAVFNKKYSGPHRAQSLYAAFIELASELETTSHFNNVMTRIAENLATLGCKTRPCTLHCDKSHSKPCTLEHASPCTLPHATPCVLPHAEPCALSHADPCTLPHFFITPEPCTLLHIDPCTLPHAEPCTLAHNEPCTSNHFPLEPERIAIPIPCPLAHNDLCTKEHVNSRPSSPSPAKEHVTIPIASPLPDAPKMPTVSNRQHKRKRFKTKKINDKLIRMHKNDVLCRSQNNSDYEMDSDGFCRDPLNRRDFTHIKRELYEEDDENFVDTMRNLMNIASDSDFLADKKPSQNGPGFIIYPSTSVSIPKRMILSSAPTEPQQTHPLPFASYTSDMPYETHPLPPASTSALPLGALAPPPSRPPTPVAPKVSIPLPRAQTEPLPTQQYTTTLPQRAQTAPPEISKNTITARRCTNKDASPSSFVKFMDIPVTMTREHIHDCLQNNRKWSSVNISNVEIFAIKNKDSTVVNVLKVKFKDDAQSTTVKRVLTTKDADRGIYRRDPTSATFLKHRTNNIGQQRQQRQTLVQQRQGNNVDNTSVNTVNSLETADQH
ncbi:hypothetical protein JOM56_015677 [Amanita muscaria]